MASSGIIKWIRTKWGKEATPVPSAPGLSESAAREETSSVYLDALDMPYFPDPVFDKLSQDAHLTIRRVDVTARPLMKIATQVSSHRIEAQGDDPATVEKIQFVIDQISGLREALEWCAWIVSEGKRYVWMKARNVNGWAIPDLRNGGRRKVQAGGIVTDYNDRIVSIRTSEQDAKEYPRERWIVCKFGAEDSPEGCTDLAWMLYAIALAAQGNDKNSQLYSERHGVPLRVYNQIAAKIRADRLQAKARAGAAKINAVNAKTDVVAKTDKEMIELVEPSGTTANFLTAYHERLEARAHSLVLQNVLTSMTGAAGPTQSSTVHKSEQDIAVEALCESIISQWSDQLVPFIIRHNMEKIGPIKGRVWLTLVPPPVAKKSGKEEARSLFDSGAPVDAEWFYASHGAPKPANVPEVIKQADYAANPLAGFPGLPMPGGQPEPAPGPSNEPQTTEVTKVADTALTGVQIDALKQTILDVANGALPAEAAVLLITASFPSIPPEKAQEMVSAAQAFTPKATPALPAPAGGQLALTIPKKGALTSAARRLLLNSSVTLHDEQEALFRIAHARLSKALDEAYWSMIDQYEAGRKLELDKRLANEIAKLRGLCDLAGRARLNREVGALTRRVALATSVATDVRVAVDLPMEEAFADFAQRSGVVARTAEQVAAAYKAHRFTVLKAVEQTMVEQIQQKILAFKETGIDRAGFRKWMTDQPGDFSKSYADLVSRNAVNASYSRGRAEQFNEFIEDDDIVGWEWSTIGDGNVRESHAMLDGVVFPKHNKNKPPKGHNCRCTWLPVEAGASVLSESAASRLIKRATALDPQFAEFNVEDSTYGGI